MESAVIFCYWVAFFFYKLHSQLQFLYSAFMVIHKTLISYQ